jgi:hypothetical protein
MSPEAQNNKTGPDAPVPLKTSPGAQNVNTGHDAHSTAENKFGSAKYENETSVQPKIFPGAKNVEKGPDALGTAENESKSAQNTKTGHDALGTTETGYGRAKHENGTRSPWNRQKWVRARKTIKRDSTPRYRRK